VAFLGTPQIAVAPLEALCAAGVEVAAVVTGPDKRRGRGSALSPTPVKAAALELGIPVHHDLGVLEGHDTDLEIDLSVVVAFGSILPAAVLARVPMVNLHFSLLPRWRGAAPVERAILAGDTRTGVCVMQVAPALDTGDLLAVAEVPLGPDATTADVWDELSHLGARLLVETLTGTVPAARPQEGEPVYAHKIRPDDVRLDWDLPAEVLGRRVRVGGAWTTVGGRRLRVTSARVHPPAPGDPAPGAVLGAMVGTGSGTLELLEVVPEGRAAQPGEAWARGARLSDGDRLGERS
jgi:methionyl-tRNA formyltransferase